MACQPMTAAVCDFHQVQINKARQLINPTSVAPVWASGGTHRT